MSERYILKNRCFGQETFLGPPEEAARLSASILEKTEDILQCSTDEERRDFEASLRVYNPCFPVLEERPLNEKEEFLNLGFFALGIREKVGMDLEQFFAYRSKKNPERRVIPVYPIASVPERFKEYTFKAILSSHRASDNGIPLITDSPKAKEYENILLESVRNLKITPFIDKNAGLTGIYALVNLFKNPGEPLPAAEAKRILKRAFRGLIWFMGKGAVHEDENDPSSPMVWKERNVAEESVGFKLSEENNAIFENWWENRGGIDGYMKYYAKLKINSVLIL